MLDTFSARTRWETIEWETDENSSARDATCKCASPGSPLTPVVLTYGLSGATEVTCAIPVSRSREEAGSELIRAPAAARYLRIRAHLYGRKAAAEVDLDLGTGAEAAPDVLGLRPALKKIRATYYARAAHAVSKPIAPESVGTWGELAFDADTPGRSSVSIDVLDESGELLLSEVSSGADLAGIINPFEHPALRLRARLEIAVENPEERPLLRSWGLSWKPTGERLRLDRTVLDRGKGESVRGMVCVEKNGVLTIRVHDVKGRMVNLLARQWVPARAQVFAWNGLARAGERVPDGRYFITASTAGGAATRSLVVR